MRAVSRYLQLPGDPGSYRRALLVTIRGEYGISMRYLLLDNGPVTRHEYFYWEFDNRRGGHFVQAIRQDDWKFLRFVEPGRTWIELYNLHTDIGEFNNLAVHYPEITTRLSNLIDRVRVDF